MTKTTEALTLAREALKRCGTEATNSSWIRAISSPAIAAIDLALSAVDDGQVRAEVLSAIDAARWYCRNCQAPTLHSQRGVDLCCDECHSITASRHTAAPAPDAGVRPVAEIVGFWRDGYPEWSVIADSGLWALRDELEGSSEQARIPVYAAPPQPAEKAPRASLSPQEVEVLVKRWWTAGANPETLVAWTLQAVSCKPQPAEKAVEAKCESSVRDALAELVACKNLREKIDAFDQDVPATVRAPLIEEYNRRKPAAWSTARAALASAPQADQAGEREALAAWKNVASEWRGLASNAMQWLRNVRSGLCNAGDAIEAVNGHYSACLKVELAVEAARPTPPAASEGDGQ